MKTKSTPKSGSKSRKTIAELCSEPVVTIPHYATMERAACDLYSNKISALVVVDELDRCVGIVTSTDIVHYLACQSKLCSDEWLAADVQVHSDPETPVDIDKYPIESVARHMTKTIQTVTADTPVTRAKKIMREQRVHHLLLLDDSDRPTGMVSSMDLL